MAPAIEDRQRLYRRLSELLTGRNVLLLNTVLGLLCLWGLVRLALLYTVPPALPELPFPHQSSPAGAFNLYPWEALSSPVAHELQAAAIDAVVMGVITRGDQARANIAVAGGADAVYSQGDRIAPGVVVERIEAGLVVVRENGELRRIPLRSLLASGERSLALVAAPPAMAVAGEGNTGVDMRVTAVITDAGAPGLRLDELDAVALSSGLIGGDVVLAVDDRPLSELMADGNILTSLSGAGQHRVRVLRDGQEQIIDIDAATVASWLTRR